mgnify:CR=1 FL=1
MAYLSILHIVLYISEGFINMQSSTLHRTNQI